MFGKKELFITFSVEKQSEVRSLLAAAGIEYELKLDSGFRNVGIRTAALNSEPKCEYKFYVKSKDYDLALKVLNGQNN